MKEALNSYSSISNTIGVIKRHLVIVNTGESLSFTVDEILNTDTMTSEYDFYNEDEQIDQIRRLSKYLGDITTTEVLSLLVDIINERRQSA
jgi:hypothetical protein